MAHQGPGYRFGPFLLEPDERRLSRDGAPVALTPKVFDTLVLLVEQAGHVVVKDALMQALWPRGHVEESNLTKHIWQIRRTLGGAPDGGQYIETLPKLGYRFCAPVVAVASDDVLPATDPAPAPAAPSRRSWRLVGAGALVVVLAALAGSAIWSTRHPATPAPVVAAAPTAQVRAALADADTRLLAGDPVAAANHLQAALRRTPVQPELEAALARALRAGGQDTAAVRLAALAREHGHGLPAARALPLQLVQQEAGQAWTAALDTLAALRHAAADDAGLALREARIDLDSGRPAAARTLARQALATGGLSPSLQANWQLVRADAEAALGDFAAEGDAAATAARLAQQAGATGLAAEAALRSARAQRHLDHVDAVLPALQQAQAGFDRIHLPRGVAQAQLATGDWYLNHGDLPAANAQYARTLQTADALGSTALRASALQSMALACWFQGHRDCAEQDAMQALTLYRRVGDPAGQAWSFGALATLHLDTAASDDTVVDYRRAIALSQDSDRAYNAWARMALADVLRLRGELEAAARECDAALARYRKLGDSEGEAGALIGCGGIAADRGDFDDAEARFRRARELYLQRDYQAFAANAVLSLATLALQRGDPARAHELAEQARTGFGGGGFETGIANALAVELLAELDLGQQAAALQHAAQLRALLSTIDSVQEVMLPKLALARARARGNDGAGALAALHSLQQDAARRHWRAWQLEAGYAEVRIREDLGDTRAATLAETLETQASRAGFDGLVRRLRRDRTTDATASAR